MSIGTHLAIRLFLDTPSPQPSPPVVERGPSHAFARTASLSRLRERAGVRAHAGADQ